MDARKKQRMRGEVVVKRDELLCGGVCFVHQLQVAGEVSDLERGQTVLARAEEIARTAQLEILLREREAVVRLRHDLEALAVVVALVVGDHGPHT